MTKFRNPYHFVPVENEIKGAIPCPADAILSSEILKHRTHDRYHPETLSGRIVCSLTTVTPIVVGSKQAGESIDYTVVAPFERNGKPAIPASTLRGCLSSLAEAASNSALRVLDDTYYSTRVNMGEKTVEDFSAIGKIVEENGVLRLLPLAMPTLSKEPEEDSFVLPEKWRKMFPAPTTGEIQETRLKAFCFEADEGQRPNAPLSYRNGQLLDYHAVLEGRYTIDDEFKIRGSGGKVIANRYFLGLYTMEEPQEGPPPKAGGGYVRGFLRSISDPQRRRDIPGTKKYELFIPYPVNPADAKTFPIVEKALEQFRRIATSRDTENCRRGAVNQLSKKKGTSQDLLPYNLKGAEVFKKRSQPYCLKDGDIVFFEPSQTGNEVIRVWVSQVWREEIPLSAHDFFGFISRELVPFNRTRQTITPAEAVFGFVELNPATPEPQTNRRSVKALASRVRFSDARLIKSPTNDPYHPEMLLRILASPKPPCPSLYFRKKELRTPVANRDCYISKKDLRDGSIEDYVPQGRKFYLNHPHEGVLNNCITAKPNEDKNQKNMVRPLKEGCRFVCHIDFENLSAWELGMVLFALEPAADFHHKIGMGKALGLGTVKLTVEGLFYVDRMTRYSLEGFLSSSHNPAARYHECWVNLSSSLSDSERFALHESMAMESGPVSDESRSPSRLREQFACSMIESIKKGLTKVGQPEVRNISSPMTATQTSPEEETFKWFQQNDRSNTHKQGLIPLEFDNDIPFLEKN